MITPHFARGWFVSSTGTSAGKTFVTRGLARALAHRDLHVAALKPLETGCEPSPLDAQALARAARAAGGAFEAPGFYRVAPPLSPYAAQLLTGCPAPDLDAIAAQVREVERVFDRVIVEGAGGLLVPLDAHRSIADLVARLGYPLLLVAPDRLGVLSHVLTVWEAATRRGLPVAAIVLTQQSSPDLSVATNARILAERTGRPVVPFPFTLDDDDALAEACAGSGLLAALE